MLPLRSSFADSGQTVAEYWRKGEGLPGESFFHY
jgi:phosphopentomutase